MSHPRGLNGQDVELVDGRKVPRTAIRALYELDKTWPGATFPGARPAIVAAVMESLGLQV